MQGNMFVNQRELRHSMISKISERIQAAVLSVGRTKEDLKKYTLNIEQTAWHNSKGDQVRHMEPHAASMPTCTTILSVLMQQCGAFLSEALQQHCAAGNQPLVGQWHVSDMHHA